MKESLLQYLVCPACHQNVELEASRREHEDIVQGRLCCRACQVAYPVVRGIPRFVPGDSYVKNFSYQWNVHRTTQVDSMAGHQESRRTFFEKTGFQAERLQGKLVLDVGCGTGRFTEIAQQCGAEVIGVDLSYAVDAAYRNMGQRPGVHIVQADLFHMPFRHETFDAVYSIGVLHHTPDTHQAFRAATSRLKPGGDIAIWVYVWGGQYSEDLDRVRSVTVHIPRVLLYGLCWALVPLIHGMARLPLLKRVAARIPTSVQGRGLTWDVLDTFDSWAPRYQWKHTESEVRGWFELEKLQDIVSLSFPVSMRGRRPVKSAGQKAQARPANGRVSRPEPEPQPL